MVRRYADPVEVRAGLGRGSGEPADSTAGPPDSFLWRGRLYVVRSVLGHWRERRSWWTDPAARAVHGEVEMTADDGAPGGLPAGGVGGLEAEREVWRVEASAGRAAGSGVYDLCHGPVSTWSLVRVAD